MPYDFSYFRAHGIYKEAPTSGDGHAVIESGEIIPQNKLPSTARKLFEAGGVTHGGDYSSQDEAFICSMLTAGYSPQDTLATFVNSPRGRHAAERKVGHFTDYVQRTVANATAFVGSKSNGHAGSVSIDFGRKHKGNGGDDDGAIVRHMHEVPVEKIHWLWPGYIAANKINIIAGDPGMGKSTIALDIVARISRGTSLPTGQRTVVGTCCVISAEDAVADTIKPRLIAAKADMRRVKTIREVRINGEERYLTFPRDLAMIKAAIVKFGLRFLVIDPMNAFIEKAVNTYRDQDIRSLLAPLEAVAEDTGCTILLVAHLNKKEDVSTLYRIGGSIGIVGAARSVLAVATTPHEDESVLYSLKQNLRRKPPALSYRTDEYTFTSDDGEQIQTNRIEWLGESSLDPSKPKDMPQMEKACIDFLKQELDGEVESTTVWADAKAVGIPARTLKRYKLELGVRAIKRGDKWYWSPPQEWPK